MSNYINSKLLESICDVLKFTQERITAGRNAGDENMRALNLKLAGDSIQECGYLLEQMANALRKQEAERLKAAGLAVGKKEGA